MNSKPTILISPASPLRSFRAEELAKELGCSRDHAYKSLRGIPVGSTFIALALLHFPRRHFEDLFIVQVDGYSQRAVTAPTTKYPTSWTAAGGAAVAVPGPPDDITGDREPDRIPILDEQESVALWFEADDTIRLPVNWRTNPVAVDILAAVGIEPDEVRTLTVPGYMVRGERHAKKEEV